MANQDVRVSALQSASTLSTDDLALATVVDELSETGYTSKKITEGAKASQYLEAFTFANLNTSAKTIVGAINEAATTGGSDEFIIHMTDTTVTESAADIIDAFDNGSEIWLESQITGETVKTRLPLLAYISDSSQLVLRFSGITYANNRYRYCDVQMLRSPEQIVGRQNVNIAFAVIDDTAVSSSTAWSSEQIVSLLPTESASGAVANFETPLTLPLVSHNVTIEPVQAGSGDPSPSNPRPISGHSSVTVSHSDADTTSPTTYTRAFYDDNDDPVTVYGGNVNLTTGEGVSDRGFISINATSYITRLSSKVYRIESSKVPNALWASDNINKLKCEKFKPLVTDQQIDIIYTTINGFIIRTSTSYDTANDMFEAVGSFGISYPLATPQTFHTDPLNLDTLEGVNNIWADTGDTAVDYKQDIQTYIDSRLSSGTRSLSLAKAPVEEETKQEEQEGGNNER